MFFRLALIFVSLVALSLASQQTIKVIGKLKCGDAPATSKNTWVALLNKKIGPDDKVEKPVNDDGTYSLQLGPSDRWGTLTPEIHIYTDCMDTLFGVQKGCQRKMVFKVPDKYVNKDQPYDAGTYNLESKLKDESRDCEFVRSFGWGKK